MQTLPTITLHGVFLSIHGIGTLLTGASGIGKSEIALELVKSGQQLIADDVPEFRKTDSALIGSCPALLQDLLHVQGLGILNLHALFGDNAIRRECRLELIIELKHIPTIDDSARLHGYVAEETILDTYIPKITIPYRNHRPMPLLVECAVRNYQLQQQGHFTSYQFEQQQQRQVLLS